MALKDLQLKELARQLASLTESEYAEVTSEARQVTDALQLKQDRTAAALREYMTKGR